MTQSPKNEKILIIEGDASFAGQLADALKKNGYADVSVVDNGTDGLKKIYDYLPHLILLDITLAGENGYEVLSKKQAEPLLAKIPVYLMSTQGVPILMKNVPQGSVEEYIMSMHASSESIIEKIDKRFGHEKIVATKDATAIAIEEDSKTKLLWVEDDKLIGKILGKKFATSDFNLFHAQNGDEALKYLQANKPNAIVVDLLLPGMSGFDILKKINEDEKLKAIPTMVLSNLSKASDIEKARSLGAKKFLVKSATSLDQIVLEVKGLCRA